MLACTEENMWHDWAQDWVVLIARTDSKIDAHLLLIMTAW